MNSSIENAIERYVNNYASYSDKKIVRDFLMSDFENCYNMLIKMRERAMRELSIENDTLIEDVISNNPVGMLFDAQVSDCLFWDYTKQDISAYNLFKDYYDELFSEILSGKL